MKQNAVVIKASQDGTATVKVLRRSACSACSARHTCGGARETEVTVKDPIGVTEGNTVEIEVPSSNVLGYSALVFFAPVFLGISLYLLLSLLGAVYGIIGAVIGFILPLIIAFFVSRANAERVRPCITAVMEGVNANTVADESSCDLRN